MIKLFSFSFVLIAVAHYFYKNGVITKAKVREPIELENAYDYVIVGGGTAGCVLASRLSEDPKVSVLVLEAGGEETDYWFSHIPYLAPKLQQTDFDWQFLTEPQKHCCSALKNRQAHWTRAKGLGGCSTHNFMNHVRCSPADYDYWSHQLNNSGWAYEDVLPYFLKSENVEVQELKGKIDQHGYDGPMKINRGSKSPLGKSMEEALRSKGYAFFDDPNSVEAWQREGFSRLQFNIDKNGVRMSAAKVYLRPAMGRPNLHVVVRAHVTRVLFDVRNQIRPRAIGVEYQRKGKLYTLRAKKEVLISGGAINSPQILMLSGIGPKSHLDSLGIPVLVDNAAVGQNLDNHIFSYLLFKTNRLGQSETHELDTWFGYWKHLIRYFVFGRGPFGIPSTEIMGFLKFDQWKTTWPADVQMYFMQAYNLGTHYDLIPDAQKMQQSPDEYVFGLAVVLQHPTDKGEIRLRSADPLAHPIIDLRWFQSSIDLDIMTKAMRTWVDLVSSSPELKQFDVRFAETPTKECEPYQLLSDDYLKCSIRSRSSDCFHPVATCRMGQEGRNSVVDQELRVHGVDGLRVIDASVIPEQITGNTHAPVIMIAEKTADMIKNDNYYSH